MRRLKRITAIILTAAFVTQSIPPKIFANEIKLENTVEPQIVSQDKKEATILNEIVEDRESNVKHFLKDDFTYEADIYHYPVHYREKGQWKDIDNSLIETTSEDNERVLGNRENALKVRIAKRANAKRLVTIRKDGYEIAWGIEQAGNTLYKAPTKQMKQQAFSESDRKRVLQNISSEVDFEEIFKNVDLNYEIISESLKESIIVKDRTDRLQLRFNLDTKNVIPELRGDNTIIFYDQEDLNKEVFAITTPYMVDAEGVTSGDIELTLTSSPRGYSMIMTPSEEWLNAKERKYPVIIDPTVGTSLDTSAIKDTHVSSSLPNDNFGLSDRLKVGRGATSGENRTYIKFALPQLMAADQIIDAKLYLINRDYSLQPIQVDVHRVLSAWTDTAMKWPNQPSTEAIIEDYAQVGSLLDYNAWDITSVVQDWHTTQQNNGVMLKSHNNLASEYMEFHSSNISSTYNTIRPQIILSYVNNAGTEDYWTYRTQGVGRAGIAYVNDYNGNCIMMHPDAATGGNRMPVAVSHIFNSTERTADKGLGNGWRLNLMQTIMPIEFQVQGSPNFYYQYVDNDGTKHYFTKKEGTQEYVDETGLGLTLNKVDATTYRIKDKQDNIMLFKVLDTGTVGYLKELQDNQGNKTILTYSGTKLQSVTDGAGKTIRLTYYSAGSIMGMLKYITDQAGRTTTFEYNGSYQLSTIRYPDGKTSTYTYTASSNMTSATNFDGYKIELGYYGISPFRIRTIKEAHTDGTEGQELTLEYGNHATAFTDVKGRKATYQFNDFGNTLSIKDEEGYATKYEYEGKDAAGKNPNDLKVASDLQRTVMNYIKNSNAEQERDWITGSDGGTIGSSSYTTEEKYLGSKSLKIEKTNPEGVNVFRQNVTLEKGKDYTFSAYIKTANVTNNNSNEKGAYLLISYQDGTGMWRAKSSRGIKGSTDWTREEVTITLPADATSSSVIARVSLEGEQGKAYFDCLQVEDGSIMNRYNLVENPDFSYGLEFWTKNPDMASGDTIVTLNDASYPKHLEKNAFKVQGQSTKSKNAYQTVFMNGKKGDVFVLGGWAKANSVPTDSNRAFRMDIGIQKTDGNWQWQNIHFNPDVSDWQYGLNSIQAAADYTSITVYLMYYNNENTAYFDGIQLYKEEFGSNYKYDSKGNLTDSNNTGKNTNIKYTAQNDIESITDPRGNETRFTEYNKHNLKKSISPEGLTTGFAYDSYGNVLTQEITDTTSGKFIKSEKTYTADGDYLKEDKTAFGKTITYDYDANRGTLSSLTDEKGRNTYYNYDPITNDLLKVYKNVGGQEVSNSYAYENDRLKSITHNQFSYLFDYSPLGDVKNVKVGTQDLITNTYEDRTGKLLKSTYGNGQEISYVYDEADRVIEDKFNGVTRYTYTYDAQGNVGRHEDLVNGVTYRYFTDVAGRNSEVRDSKGNTTQWLFDENGNTTHLKENLSGVERNTDYFYDKDNKLTKVSYNNNNSKILYNYKGTTSNPENLGRLTDVTVHVDGENRYKTKYSYIDGINGANSTTGIVSSVALSKIIKVTNPLTNVIEEQEDEQKLISYTYDDSGNIETITHPDGKIIRYYYDELNQLIREDNQIVNKTIDYIYDVGGNIQTKVESDYTTGEERNNSREYRYEYDTAWKDKLINYDGKAFEYDPIGNIINDSEYAYSWEQGRRLSSMQKTGQNITFKYNAQGIRTEKTVNGLTTQYHLVGDQVTYETDGTDTIYYTYDSAGNLVSMNLNGIEYYYIYNAQGDIISLIDAAGNEVVSYTYDTWGKLLSIEGALKDTVGIKNPYRYRGYRYDIETRLYYLGLRYYNPEWDRFINADGNFGNLGELLSCNIFAYCKNSPVNLSDSNGQVGIALPFLWGGVASVLQALAATVVAVASSPVVITVALIAATGFLAYTGYQYYTTSRSALVYSKSKDSGGDSNTKAKKPSGKIGPYDEDVTVVDPAGNAIPLKEGDSIEGRPDSRMWQVKDKNGNPTGDRFDGQGHPKQADPKARFPHGHRVDAFGNKILDDSGNPHLPVKPPTW